MAGLNSEGLTITRLPAANALLSGLKIIAIGKFQGDMMPTTPLG